MLALIVTLGYQKHIRNVEQAKKNAIIAEKLSEQLAADSQSRINHMMHGLYLKSVCDFKKNLEPVSEILLKINSHESIPPDLLPEMKKFNDAAQFMAMDEKIFLKKSEMNDKEILIEADLKLFAKEVKLKTAELESSLITPSDKYFSELGKRVEILVSSSCEEHKASYPESTPTPTPTPKASHAPGSIDAQIDKIGKQVSYEAICKLQTSGNTLIESAQNSKSSVAFKSDLLEASKNSIYDLGYAAFSFNGNSLYSPSPSEKQWTPQFESLKKTLEKARYGYWSTNSKAALGSMQNVAEKMQVLGASGCIEVQKLKKS